ncbi:DUF1430 domain-containing protein [Lysinibacillus xylanilyticus]|uniref:DUF1430 domain-containing protein n=1 Tax=Lysinibacillus xylanilyticus TaxID=582475 RepID=UPI002B23F4EF|nr:DUF1430 domain-containing protein [Lysinibacillus xylanilyticus]MEB2301777.1 DUF1430 domain-containing protein [Lysinibacillus xylanilyticus]
MKKVIYLFLTIVIITSNLFSFSLFSNNKVVDFLYKRNQIVMIDFSYAKINFNVNEFTEHLVEFSKKNNINISQYNFISENSLNIYSTNVLKDSYINLKSGEYPIGKRFIANHLKEDEKNQSGIFYFPLSNWEFHIYDFKQIKNVGFKNEFYLSSGDKEILHSFTKEFSPYGKVLTKQKNISSLALINISLLMIVIFSFVIYIIGIFYFLIQKRKTLLLNYLWGYSKAKIVCSFFSPFLRFSSIVFTLVSMGLIVFLVIFKQVYFLKDFFPLFILVNTLILMILLFVTLLGILLIFKFNKYRYSVKGALPFRKIQWMSIILKTLVSIVLFSMISFSFMKYNNLTNKLNSLSYWDDTQNVFRIEVGVLNNSSDNLKLDRDLNDRLSLFYEKIKKNNQAFLIEAEKFSVINYKDGKPIYSYMLGIKNTNDLYTPQGRRIVIDENYLKVNPIQSSNGVSIIKQLHEDKNTLNVLVPEHLNVIEEHIVNSYRDWFYFQSVEIVNMYNKELAQPLIEKKIDDLKINIIYTKKGQEYFTYSNYRGNQKNSVIDPVAILYTDSLDTSTIGAYTTHSLFFLDNSNGNAYENISTSLEEANAKEINSVVSVYDEASDEIIELKWELFQQLIGLTIVIIFSFILFIAYIWSYYNAHLYQLTLKYLFGYSYWKRNKTIILITSLSNIFAAVLVYYFFKSTNVILLLLGTLFLELLFLYIFAKFSNEKNTNKVVKGD